MNVKIIVLLCLMLFPCIVMSAAGDYADKIIATKNTTGRLVSFSRGDYAHVSLKQSNGTMVDFFVYDEVCFLAKHRDVVLEIKYQEVERYFVEGAGYFPANIILTIETKNGLGKWDLLRDKWSENIDYLRCHQELEQLSSK